MASKRFIVLQVNILRTNRRFSRATLYSFKAEVGTGPKICPNHIS